MIEDKMSDDEQIIIKIETEELLEAKNAQGASGGAGLRLSGYAGNCLGARCKNIKTRLQTG